MKLSTYIADDLRERLRAGGGPPCKLTLTALSDFYRVSPMPVRTAVGALLAEQFLHKEENGRLGVTTRDLGPARAARPVAPPPDWYKLIAADVIRQSLR